MCVCTVLVLTLSGCAPPPSVPPDTLIGKSVTAAVEQVPTGTAAAWYDLSEAVLHQPGTLIGGPEPDGAGGVVIAVCADADTIARSTRITTGAIPRTAYDSTIRRRAAAGDFRRLLPECAGG
jgi:hypothetical protein